MFLELGAVFVLILLFWPATIWDGSKRPSTGLLSVLALLLLYPLLYLLPVPADIWALLPGAGREPYRQATALLTGQSAGWLALTLSPALTESYWLAFLPPLAVFLGILALPERHRLGLAYLAVGMGVFQSLLGLMQFGAAHDSFLCFGADICGTSARGTYYNYDHLAGLLEMLLPVAVGLVSANMGRAGQARRYRESWRKRMAFWISAQGHVAAVLSAGCIAMLLGLVFTRSRSGIMIIMLGILVCLLVFGRRLGTGNKASKVVGTVIVVTLGLALDIGLAPVLQRFSFADPLHDSRMLIYSHALEGIGKFLPLGSGPGTFPEAFRQFQPVELGNHFINHAHNDYLEWLFEGGVAAAALALLLFAAYLRQWLGLAAGERRGPFRFVQFGAGIGLLLLLLHGLSDFNWHIPANALYAALLAGLFLGRPDEQGGDGQARAGTGQGLGGPEPRSLYVLARPQAPVRNPFDDRAPG
jgi:O-antigen ligase